MQNDRAITEQETRQHIRQVAEYYNRVVPPSTAAFNGIKAALVALAAVLAGGCVLYLIGKLKLMGIIS